MARRLVERGVRFVQLLPPRLGHTTGSGSGDDIVNRAVRSFAGLPIRPLPRWSRISNSAGLLDSTLVVWGGEFGRTPMNEARSGSKFLGRDHHPRAFTMWMAGGGIQPGVKLWADR